MKKWEEDINVLFDELVPSSGKAASKAGEIIRAFCRIHYRWWNDGDQIGIGYGKETCNPAARFLKMNTNKVIANKIDAMWGAYAVRNEWYDDCIERLGKAILEYIEKNPGLKSVETDDMFDYRDVDEDVYDSWEDEDEY